MKSFFKVGQRTFYFLHEIQTLLHNLVQVHLLLRALYFFMGTALLAPQRDTIPLEAGGLLFL